MKSRTTVYFRVGLGATISVRLPGYQVYQESKRRWVGIILIEDANNRLREIKFKARTRKSVRSAVAKQFLSWRKKDYLYWSTLDDGLKYRYRG